MRFFTHFFTQYAAQHASQLCIVAVLHHMS